MNYASFVGRFVRDPLCHQTQTGLPFARFTLAVNRQYGRKKNDNPNKQTADFIPCVAWRGRADIIQKYCAKGSQVAVRGKMQSRNYQDRQGNRRYIVELNVEDIEFLGAPRAAAATQQGPFQGTFIPDDEIPLEM